MIYTRHVIVIYAPAEMSNVELSALAYEAEEGAAICSSYRVDTFDTDARPLPADAAEFFATGGSD